MYHLIKNAGKLTPRCFPRIQEALYYPETILWRNSSRPHLLHHKSVLCVTCYSTESGNNCNEVKSRFNPLGIQLLSDPLHAQIFGESAKSQDSVDLHPHVKKHLAHHGLWDKPTTVLPEVDFRLPPLLGNSVDEHFRKLAWKQTEPYRVYGNELADSSLPPIPDNWVFAAGWTRYNSDGTSRAVDFPEEGVTVFDVEVLVSEGQYPTIATAASPSAWYSWCSKRLTEDKFQWSHQPSLEDLIPMETRKNRSLTNGKPRLLVGHNVSFDRSFIKEQYLLKGSRMNFIDTMALHIAISGFSSVQRMLYMAKKSGSQRKELREVEKKNEAFGQGPLEWYWMKRGSMNNLNDVYQLYCKEAQPLDKEIRDVFVEGTMPEIREQFQTLMTYCASDVKATHSVFSKLWPVFFERFPHPVTLSGMLEMSTAYLPVNQNWQRYIEESSSTFSDLQREMKLSLMQLANDACQLKEDNKFEDDPWLFDLDWKSKELKLKKSANAKPKKPKKLKDNQKTEVEDEADQSEETAEDRINRILATAAHLPKVSPHMPGHPNWYRDLCSKDRDENWAAGPSKITTQVRVAPKLLRLLWDGFPVYYDAKYGWGYLVGLRKDNLIEETEDLGEAEERLAKFPTHVVNELTKAAIQNVPEEENKEMQLQQLIERFNTKIDALGTLGENVSQYFIQLRTAEEQLKHIEEKKKKTKSWEKPSEFGPPFHRGDGPYNDVNIPGCWFFKIPHKDGAENRVGNPLAATYLSKTEDGTLRALAGSQAEAVLKLSKMCSYWKNNEDRIKSQLVISLGKGFLPKTVTESFSYDEKTFCGAILPRLITAGTVTRRAVERTWLTASNAYADRVGSELKSMIQCPPGYHFVGADVDSQELWIASVLGDAQFSGLHGCTAFGWMTLQGQKSEGTDLHSKTAATAGITRDQAKVMNYARIYGAGQNFAERLLVQFNHRLTKQEASRKAKAMYTATKGKRIRVSNYKETEDPEDEDEPTHTLMWQGGSESHMFNKLESIANSKEPKTPILGASISRTLEPVAVTTQFMTSRVNWVVQSSAVDYLHLMLVCMKWLFREYNIDGRFCISIHDEVRYLVKSEDRYRAALALQIANILTRSMFAHKLGMGDLPQSVAFFSAVDLDTCMRKEVNMDCKTPSNPHGLQRGYSIPSGEALNIYDILKKTNSSLESSKQPEDRTDEEEESAAIQ